MLKDIGLVGIALQQYMVGIYIAIFWYKNQIHQFILVAMMSHCLQFEIITNKLFLDVLAFFVSIVFYIMTIGNKKLASKTWFQGTQ